MNKRKDKGRLPPFVPVDVEVMSSPAWRVTSFGARWLYMHLKRRWSFKQRNNGRIFLSQRDAQEEMGCTHRDSISRWFRELQHYGFIVMTDPGGLGVDGKGKAPHWRLTEAEWSGGPNGNTWMLPTKDYLKWNGTRFRDNRGDVLRTRKRKQNPGPESEARVARKARPGLAAKARPLRSATGPESEAIQDPHPGPESEAISRLTTRVVRGRGDLEEGLPHPEGQQPLVPYSQRDIDHERHSREGLMTYVANVIEEQLHDLDPSRVRARQRAQARVRELCPFDPVGGKGASRQSASKSSSSASSTWCST